MLKLFTKTFLLLILIFSVTLLYQKNTYAYHTLVHINPLPQTQILIEQKKYVDAYTYLHYFMQFEYVAQDPKAQKLIKEINTIRSSLSYNSDKIAEGIRTGTSDELSGQLSAIGSDFFLIGDIRDLALEATHYFNHEKVDTLLVSLSSIGIVASAGTLFTLGSSSVAKSTVSVLKLAHKSKHIPSWLSKYLIQEAKVIKKSKNIESLKPLFNTISQMQKNVGLKDTLTLLSYSNSLENLKGITKLSKRYKKETATLLKLSNNRLITQAKQLKDIDKQTIKLASTYGANGFIHLLKGGEKNFIKTTKRLKAYAKVGYKGEIWKVVLWLMKHLSDTILILMISIASLLLIPWRRFT